MFSNITGLLNDLYEELGYSPLVVCELREGDRFVAMIKEDKHTLLDRNGELFLRAEGNTVHEAMTELDKLCG